MQEDLSLPHSATIPDHIPPQAERRLALDQLRVLDSGPEATGWRHWVLALDSRGRVTLPAEARRVGDASATVRAASRDRTLVLRREGLGAPIQLDERGRLVLPLWLRRLAGPAGTVLVAARCRDSSLVVVTPTSVLDTLFEGITGEVG